jgi:pantoate--beta-alanine ligase
MNITSQEGCGAAWAIVGAGRVGTALAAALRAAGLDVEGPLRRDEPITADGPVILCVPDGQIAPAARAVRGPRLVGHTSGATTLDALLAAGHEAFSVHPLMTVPHGTGPEQLSGAPAAVAGSTPRALRAARWLAEATGLRPIEIADADRAAYHAAASIAANLLVTLEDGAERLLATAGADRDVLVPLVRAAVESWAALGGERALTGPIARGDQETVARQRAAVQERTPDLLDVFDALAAATERLALRGMSVGRASAHAGENVGRASVLGPATAHGMRIVRTVAELREVLAGPRRAGATIGLVPTMGALHEGHAALLRRARAECGLVVMSLFVNPAQFNDASDLAAYPRDEAADAAIAAAEGVDLVFAPAPEEVYPGGFATTVKVAGPALGLEGEHRGPGHFEGVATVVLKLLNMAQPDVAYFGQKDGQQLAVIRRMVRDLDVPVRIEPVPTVREPDGLALSSRNVRLGAADRRRALALRAGLQAAARSFAEGQRGADRVVAAARAAMTHYDVDPEYLAVVDADTFRPLDEIDRRALIAVAARVGDVRLIDNQPLNPNGSAP